MVKKKLDDPGTGRERGKRRRVPTQKRALATLDAIASAASKLFAEHGYAAVSTNHIADEANVSIGSLYQYFRDKEAIASHLYEEAIGKIAHHLKRKIFQLSSADVEKAVPQLIEAVLICYEDNALALLYLLEEVPELRKTSKNLNLELLIHSACRVYITQHQKVVDAEEAETLVYFVSTTILEHVRKYVIENPENISRDVFIYHLARLITYYMKNISD